MTGWRAFSKKAWIAVRSTAALRLAVLLVLVLGLLPARGIPAVLAGAAAKMNRTAAALDGPNTIILPLIASTRDDLAYAESGLVVRQVSAAYGNACAVRTAGQVICWGLDAAMQAVPYPGLYAQVSVGASHTCAIREDGTLACWGDNSLGQLNAPEGVFQSVSAGSYHTCAIREDGALACWGWNGFQQLDNIPAGVFAQVSAGNFHTCALRADGGVACWGWNADNQTDAPAGTFTQVSAGGSHSCAVRVDDGVACWGSNLSLQSTPPPGDFAQVSAGTYHTCALRMDGSIECWGGNGYGQLNNIPGGAFQQISGAGQNTCAIRAEGTLACWGWNRYGQSLPPSGVQASAGYDHACAVGLDGMLSCWGQNGAGQLDAPGGYFTRVSAGEAFNCASSADGSLACWGSDAAGQLGAPLGVFAKVSAGKDHACALGYDGQITCWGSNADGKAAPPAGVYTQVSAGGDHSCALKPDGSLACWGAENGKSAPPAGTFVRVSAGGSHSCAISVLGALSCWGDNRDGQASPPAGTFTQVSAGTSHTCAVRADGSIACWGSNRSGQSIPPVGVFDQVSASDDSTCAVRLDGAITCWGGAPETGQISVLPESLPAGLLDTPYEQAITASGGAAPYTFKVVAGGLPEGLSLSPEGLLSGTPAAAGAFTFTVEAADSSVGPHIGQRAYTLAVNNTADLTAPVITPHVEGTQGLDGWYVSGVTVRWEVIDAESAVTSATGCEETSLPDDTSGRTLTCTATSAGGTATRSVTVKIDQTPPEGVAGTPERAPDHNGWYNHSLMVQFSGSDATSGIAACDSFAYSGPDSAAAVVAGTCTDRAGNASAPAAFTFAYDATKPRLEPVVEPNPVIINGQAVVKANAADDTAGLASVTCGALDTASVGLKSVTCQAEDAAGNRAQASAAYNVIYRFSGFQPPVENLPVINDVVAGQTVPLKFRLADDRGTPVTATPKFSLRVEQYTCPTGEKSQPMEALYLESVLLNQGGGQFHYNWQTSPGYAHTCKRVVIDLGEGPGFEHAALFHFRK